MYSGWKAPTIRTVKAALAGYKGDSYIWRGAGM
jgi:hypothetical protein